ncbi:cytochrome c-type biogenesis protein CcmE [Azospirillum fermentarium]|uniref:cytochrome c maturation protein CcmE n=1 Tax=Azospirillum fermentarium TaxID=1233114 RepID=UPI002227E0EB|nr:cytochrome c maturation protein CcmE [Azospirillum fermentarium]MCW2244519.1 cytochrome c-type biogenesis protein CcmE [Azospirillum fermentarium]
MTRKKRRLYMLVLALLGLGTATALTLTAFQDNLVFFFSPSDLQTKGAQVKDRSFRLGGLVEDGSVRKQPDGVTVEFRVTDTINTVAVSYRGQLPDLFREGQGVVAEGKLRPDGVFAAREVLAKHDEKYMPPEVTDALKRAGQYKPAEANAAGK